jgi:hypothetical protein
MTYKILPIEIINIILSYALEYENYYDLLILNKNIYKYFSKNSKYLLHKLLKNEKSMILIHATNIKHRTDFDTPAFYSIFFTKKIDFLKFYEKKTNKGYIELEHYYGEAQIEIIPKNIYNNIKLKSNYIDTKLNIAKTKKVIFISGKKFIIELEIDFPIEKILKDKIDLYFLK